MPKLKEQGRVRAHRWRDSIFVQLVIRYPRSARLFLLFLLLSISYRIWEIGAYLLAQQARVQMIESVRSDEPNQFKEAQQIRKKLDQISLGDFKDGIDSDSNRSKKSGAKPKNNLINLDDIDTSISDGLEA